MVVASGIAAGISVVLAASAFVLEYAVGGTGGAPVGTVFAAMVGVHTLIGIGEGIITALTVGVVLGVRPDLVYGAQDLQAPLTLEDQARAGRGGGALTVRSSNLRLFLIAGLLVTIGLALVVSGFASSSPDGLEKVAEDKGFLETAQDHLFADGPLADYAVKGVGNERLSTGLSGLIGVLITFGVGLALFALVRPCGRAPGGRGSPGTGEDAGPTRAP